MFDKLMSKLSGAADEVYARNFIHHVMKKDMLGSVLKKLNLQSFTPDPKNSQEFLKEMVRMVQKYSGKYPSEVEDVSVLVYRLMKVLMENQKFAKQVSKDLGRIHAKYSSEEMETVVDVDWEILFEAVSADLKKKPKRSKEKKKSTEKKSVAHEK